MTLNHTLKRSLAALLAPVIALMILASAQPVSSADTNGPAIWKLEDADSEIWLFGTVHILKPSLEWENDQISAAFNAADTLITEAAVHDIEPAAMQGLVMKHGINQTGPSFLGKLSPEGRKNFETLLTSLGMPAAAVNNFAPYRPWLAAVTLQTLKIQSMGGDPEAGVDKLLWKQAQAAGKKLEYLETAEEQIQIFGKLSPEEELYFFEEGLKQMIEEPDLLDKIVADWKVGNIEDLTDKMQASMVGQDTLYDVLLTKRNSNWADQIKTLMDGEGKVFIAVGAAHLAGEDSVQDILKEKYGLTAKRQ